MTADSDAILAGLIANPILGKAERSDLIKIVPHCQYLRLQPGRRFLREGEKAEHVYALVEGGVRVFHKGPEDSELVVKLFGPPAFFGEADVLLNISWLESVETVLPSELIRIPGSVFATLLRRDHRLSNEMVVDLSARLLIATEQARQLAFGSAESSLASLLTDYVDLFGVDDAETGGKLIEVRLSQEKLARSLSMSRKTVQRTLLRWKEDGVLDQRGRSWVVKDVQALRTMSTRIAFGLAYKLEPGSDD